MTQPREALILFGPTGSGKTPLGEMLAARGYRGRPCAHFDFGENLRQLAAREQPDAIVSAGDIAFLREVLARGALLEDRDFPLAQRILESFLVRHATDPRTLIVMNGLPRHRGQAQALEALLHVCGVVLLRCTPPTVVARIAANVGGDRTHRGDDARAAVEAKLRVYAERTEPLIEYYRILNVPIHTLDVTATMTVEQAWSQLQHDSTRGCCRRIPDA
jgi:adenylate kinase family enzyme